MIAVRPPEYWPRIEYMALLDRVDLFVIADIFQYSRQSFQNRARIRTPDGSQWISIPVMGQQHGRPILDVGIRGKPAWIRKHWRALCYNYRSTPYFDYFEEDLRPIFHTHWGRLADLTIRSVKTLQQLLGVRTPVVRASELAGAPRSISEVLFALGTSDLLIPREAAEIDGPIASAVLDVTTPAYRQNFQGFESGMSALDLLFNYGPESMRMIRSYASVTLPTGEAPPQRC